MSRPTLSICTRCSDADESAFASGERLYERVKKLRKALELKEVFAVDEVDCLGFCDTPCAVQLEGKKRSTYTRVHVHAEREVEALVLAAKAYAALAPGEELPERRLPGVSGD